MSIHILCLGINHIFAPIQLREKLGFDEDRIRAAFSRLLHGQADSALQEMVILSTCNRVEIYAALPVLNFAELEAFLQEATQVDELPPRMYRLQDMEAVHHLFQVAAGLDSMVIGEPQILGQVTKALNLARAENAPGPILNRLFQSAIHAGKRARSETGIGRNPVSVSSLAASMAERAVANITLSCVVVLGAGEMAELTVEALRKRGVPTICVINRTRERAEELGRRWDANASTYEYLPQAILAADILIASTGAPHFIITRQMILHAMHARQHRPLVLIDIAVPRNIDPASAGIPHVKLLDIDGLNATLEDALASRKLEIPRVQKILDAEVREFEEFLESLTVLPVIADIRQQAEAIRAAELEKTLRRLPDLTDAERERIEALTQSLVSKILDQPTRQLRNESSSPHVGRYASVARMLFGLERHANTHSVSSESFPPASISD